MQHEQKTKGWRSPGSCQDGRKFSKLLNDRLRRFSFERELSHQDVIVAALKPTSRATSKHCQPAVSARVRLVLFQPNEGK